MMLRQLVLERYGPFAGTSLDFAANVPLHVVYGPNEAGKTSALAGITELLFGIEGRTRYAFQYEYNALRISGTIQSRGQSDLTFKRRKGTQNTLLGPDDQALPDSSLNPFLGGADRSLFQSAFGLSHDTLRQGGNEMLRAGGDVGRSLIEAGGGLSGLAQALEALEERANALFTPRRAASKQFYEAVDRLEVARKALRVASLSADEWEAAKESLAQSEQRRTVLRDNNRLFEEQRAKANRTRRVLPIISALDTTLSELSPIESAVDLAPDFTDRVRAAREALARARLDLERENGRILQLESNRASLEVHEAFLSSADEIRGLYDRRGEALKAQRDLPVRQSEAQAAKAAAQQIADRLGLTDLSLLQSSRPTDAFIARTRRLLRDCAATEAQIQSARSRVRDIEAALRDIKRRIETAGSPVDPAPLRRSLETIRPLSGLVTQLAATIGNRDTLARLLADKLQALPGWQGDAARLATAPVPSRESIDRFSRSFSALSQREAVASDTLRKAKEEIELTDHHLSELQAEGQIPTIDSIRESRIRRDDGWRLVKLTYIDGVLPVPDHDIAQFSGGKPLPEAYEGSVADADGLSDRREAEADRLRRYAAAVATRSSATRKQNAATTDLVAIENERTGLDGDWSAAWAGAGLEPLMPAEMGAWLTQREEILRLRDALEETNQSVQKTTDEHDRLLSKLFEIAAVMNFAAGTDARNLLERVEAAVEQGEREWQIMRDLRLQEQQQEQGLATAHARSAEATNAADAWRDAWANAMGRVGLAATATAEEAEATLGLWEQAPAVLEKLAALEHRINRMDEDLRLFGDDARDLGRRILPNERADDPIAFAKLLSELLGTVEKQAARRAEIDRHLTITRGLIVDSNRKDEDANAELKALGGIAGVEMDQLEAAALKATRKRDLLANRDRQRGELLSSGDGLTEDELRQEVMGLNPDTLAAFVIDLTGKITQTVSELEQVGQDVQACNAKIDELRRRSGADRAAQQAQDALADIRRCSNEWVRIRAAAILLWAAIDRYRRENQGPLLKRAGDLFEKLTLGSFRRFAIDYDSEDTPLLVGERPNGAHCSIDGMSEGTRDQLYLALRVATVERYCESAEPLPFIADDLFVHFDDGRAVQGLEVLSELGARTQVILFTHHHHLVTLCQGHLPSDKFRVHELPSLAIASMLDIPGQTSAD